MFRLEGKQKSELNLKAACLFSLHGEEENVVTQSETNVWPQIALKLSKHVSSLMDCDVAEMSRVIMSCDFRVEDQSCALPWWSIRPLSITTDAPPWMTERAKAQCVCESGSQYGRSISRWQQTALSLSSCISMESSASTRCMERALIGWDKRHSRRPADGHQSPYIQRLYFPILTES